MNTEQVVEMIDAISEGRNYRLDVNTTQTSDEMYVGFDSGAIVFHGVGMSFLSTVTDPRTAREIAGALVAWANRKDAQSKPGELWLEELKSKSIEAMGYDPVATQQVAAFDANSEARAPSPEDWKAIKNGYDSRANWYRRNVGRMSQETKDRNLKDLKAIQKTVPGGSIEWSDIQAAIQILLENGGNPSV